MARGGEEEVDAATSRPPKRRFPHGPPGPRPEAGEALLRELGDLIAKHVPEIAKTETRDTGQVIAQTAKQLGAALGR